MLRLPFDVYFSASRSAVSPELLNFHLKNLAGGSASTSQDTNTCLLRAAPITIEPKYLHMGLSANGTNLIRVENYME